MIKPQGYEYEKRCVIFMPGLINRLSDIFSYKEPKDTELGFELLEDENEDKNQTKGKRDVSGQKNIIDSQNCTHDSGNKPNKQPLTVKKWNENRKNENKANGCEPDNNSDTISNELRINLEIFRQKFSMPRNQDIVIREFKIGREVKAFIAYIDGMTDKKILNLAIFPQLMAKDVFEDFREENLIDYLIENIITVHNLDKSVKFSDVVQNILNGVSALFVEGFRECILIETKGYEKRNVEKPTTETVVKGPQEGFTESLRTNVSLVRKIIRNEKLVTEILPVGKTNHSNCAVMYLEEIANPNVVREVKKRINSIDTDFILGDGMIEQFIEDNPLMLFPQIISTERPDRTASFIMEGQVVILADGSPFALAVPITFFHLFQTSEDSFVRFPSGIFLRLIRIFGLFCATLLPGLYVGLVLYHPEMIPTELLTSIATSKESVPFPTLMEVMIMEVAFELIREGGIRVPSVIGQTLGIVGALILGQAAVAAGLVSPLLVIIVSVTGLGSFAIPNYPMALTIRIERFFFIFAAAVFGFYGISLMFILMAFIACSMKSFGVPFFSPLAPKTASKFHVVMKYPVWAEKSRSDEMNTRNRKKQGKNQKVWTAEKNAGEDNV